MRSLLFLITILHHCWILSLVNGQVDDLPPPPPPPIPPQASEIIPPTEDTAESQLTSNDTEIPANETNSIVDINENGTSVVADNTTSISLPNDPSEIKNASLPLIEVTENDTDIMTTVLNTTISNQTSDQTLDETNVTMDSNASQVLSDILSEIEISKNDTLNSSYGLAEVTPEIGNDTVTSNDTLSDTTGIELATNKTDEVGVQPEGPQGGFKVALPPPPPIIGAKTENIPLTEDSIKPASETIDANATDVYGINDTSLSVTADDNITSEVSLPRASTNVSEIDVPLSLIDQTDPFVPTPIPEKSVPVKHAIKTAPGLPPPIIVPDISQIKTDSQNETPQNIIPGEKTKDSSKQTATLRPPPPPIIFTKDIIPTSWIDPRMKQTTRAPLISVTSQMKPIPSEMDPKYMSVSELAYYTLQEMKRQKKEREMKAKGMGVQVFFNTLQPIEKETTQKIDLETTPSSIKGSFDIGNVQTTIKYQRDDNTNLIQTTQNPVSPVKPLESLSTSDRQFYGADYLLSQLGINMPKTTQPPPPTSTTTSPMVTKSPIKIPPGLFKPFLPIIHDTRLSPPAKPVTRAPLIPQWKTQKPIMKKTEAPSQMFFDSNFLLNQLGLNANQEQRTRSPTTNSPLLWQKTHVPRIATTRSPLFQQQTRGPRKPFRQQRPTTKPPTTRSSLVWQQAQRPTTRSPVIRPPFNQQFVQMQRPIQTFMPRITNKPNIVQHNFGTRQTPTLFGASLRQNVINQIQFKNDQGIKNQRFGQFHTRPIDLTKPKPHDITDHSINVNKPNTFNNPNHNTDNFINVPTTPVPLTNLNIPKQSSDTGFIPFVFGSTPIGRDTHLLNKKKHTNINTGSRLRQKFNQRLQRTREKEVESLWKKNMGSSAFTVNPSKRDIHIASNAFDETKPTQDNNFNTHQNRHFNTFNIADRMINVGRRIQSVQQENDIPTAVPEVRGTMKSHQNIDTYQPNFQSGLQQLQNINLNNINFNNFDFQSQFPLAAQLGESHISHLRTLELQTNPIQIDPIRTNVNDKPILERHNSEKRGTQTHWSAQPSNSWQNNAAHVPYRVDQFRTNTPEETTPSPMRYIPKTTINPFLSRNTNSYTPQRVQTLPTQPPPTTTTTTTLPTTTTTTTTTTTLPTVPPTADPNPPPIFDTRILQTFMPMPKPGDTTPPTDFGNGEGNNSTITNKDGSCTGCVFVNDRCLLPHPKHCSMYIECVRQNKQVRSFTRECALGAFFDRKSFLCVDPKIADCPTDRCRESGLKWYPIEGHCKHYWSCGAREGGAAFAQSECCPDMGGFLEGQGCVENPNCTESCDQAINRNTPTGCKLKMTASPTVYYDENAKMERPCAPGTLFNEIQCTCVQDVTLERRENRTGGENCSCTNETTCACRGQPHAATGESNCPASLILNFDKEPVIDTSSTKQHIGDDGVATTKAGEGIFNGGSKLTLWRYANLMIPLVFAVRLKFLATATEPRIQTLLSNCDKSGAIDPTFDVSIDTLYGEVIFTIDTYDGQAKKFKIMYEPNVWATVDVIYDGERLVGSVNGRPRNIISAGGIETRPFPLSIGGCGTSSGYKGLMENVHIYEKCIPDEMYGIFMAVLE